MSLIPYTLFPRSMFDMDLHRPHHQHGTQALDVFDPFDELDTQLNSMIHWLDRPPIPFMQPKVPQKYRVTLDCAGFNPKAIKTEIAGDTLIVTGHEGDAAAPAGSDNFSHRSFKKTFNLPMLVEKDKMTSFMTSHGKLVIDIPYKMDESGQRAEDMWPTIVDTPDGHKQVNLNMHFPCHVDPSEVHVTAKDRDIIVKAKHKTELPDGYSTLHYYRRTTMPDGTDLHDMKCKFDDNSNHLTISAPLGGNALKSNDKKMAIGH